MMLDYRNIIILALFILMLLIGIEADNKQELILMLEAELDTTQDTVIDCDYDLNEFLTSCRHKGEVYEQLN